MSEHTPLRLSTPDELAELLPHLLGYHPDNSIIVAGINTTTGALQGTLRTDIPADEAHWAFLATDLIATLLERSAHHGGTVSQVALYICADPNDPGYGYDSLLHHAPLAHALRNAALDHELRIADLLYTTATHWWSYLTDTEPTREGTPIRGPHNPGSVTAYAVVEGLPTPRRRADILATLAPIDGTKAEQQHAALDTAVLALTDRIHAQGHEAVKEQAVQHLRATLESLLAGDAATDIDPDLAAQLILTLHYAPVRDAAYGYVLPDELPILQNLWRHLAQRCVPDYRHLASVPIALFGINSWGQDDTATAAVAFHAALEAEPAYGFAQMMLDAINQSVPFDLVKGLFLQHRASRTTTAS
ncbi:DUF4192 domain-containing protein [Kitasatospora sp. RB6PN24]|uniref:DUF4192 domain-containing protein n=1 Tax=Kitasatospora humi TaxID=2893891 RepID=UPI001E5E0D6E|nr:DUF4192 domain-containing protein [Kitasatospora humi]MCC9309099.1 DUF4192 domain-containing protein [Kitasatospora humi]